MTSRPTYFALRASGADPRLSWCGLLPPESRGLAVLVHGSDRDAVGMLRVFRSWAETERIALVAPLFPGGVPVAGDCDGYKSLRTSEYRYDEALANMLEDARALGVPAGPFLLFGFSGGAQFAHRYALAHPENVRALGIVAPGNVTRFGVQHGWWAGVHDADAILGSTLRRDAIGRIPVLALVGADDDGRDVITIDPGQRRWVEGANDAGTTRVDRLIALVDDWRAAGIDVEHEVVSGAGHELDRFTTRAQSFFSRVIDRRGGEGR